MKTLTWQKPGQQNVAQELIKIIINYVAELRVDKTLSDGDTLNTAYSASVCAAGACLHDAAKAAQPTNTISRIHFLFIVIIFQSFLIRRQR